MNGCAETKKKYLIMPDSFKGTMDAIEVCEIMKRAVLRHDKEAQVTGVPVADGGEGTVDCFLHAFGGEKIPCRVTGPYGDRISAFYGKIGETAVVEMAAVCGFVSGQGRRRDPSIATTFGVGELIKKAVEDGCDKIILGLGGSCTNDGGAGLAAALGVDFYNQEKKTFVPTGKTLCQIRKIDVSRINRVLEGVKVQAMCDIDNPLYGPNGAAYIFGPQKGADADMVKLLDDNLKYYAGRIEDELGIDVACVAGSGAAGGMGAGACAFLNAELKQGIDVILDLLDFESLLQDCRAVFTGEGRLDRQSLGGKVVVGIGKRARKAEVPVIAVVGAVKGDISPIFDLGVTNVFKTDPGVYRDQEEMILHCREDLEKTMDQIFCQLFART